MFCSGENVSQYSKHRIAIVIGWSGNQHVVRFADDACQLRRRAVAVEHQRLQMTGIVGIEDCGAFGASHGADDALELLSERGNKMLRAIAEAETDERGHQSLIAVAAVHSAMTSGSGSPPLRIAQRSSRLRSSRPSAQTAAPRTSGEGS